MKDLLKIYRIWYVKSKKALSHVAARYIICNISYFNIELRISISSYINTIRPITYMEVVISEGG